MARLILFSTFLLILTACLTPDQRDAVEGASNAVGSVAPLLPPPFGIIAGGVATLLAGVAAVGANKVSNEKHKKKEEPSLLIKLATDHSSTLLASIVPVATILKASGILPISDGEFASIVTTLAAPVVVKKRMRV